MLIILFLVVLLVLAVGSLPTWPYSRNWGYGYYPSGGLGLILLIVLFLYLFRLI